MQVDVDKLNTGDANPSLAARYYAFEYINEALFRIVFHDPYGISTAATCKIEIKNIFEKYYDHDLIRRNLSKISSSSSSTSISLTHDTTIDSRAADDGDGSVYRTSLLIDHVS